MILFQVFLRIPGDRFFGCDWLKNRIGFYWINLNKNTFFNPKKGHPHDNSIFENSICTNIITHRFIPFSQSIYFDWLLIKSYSSHCGNYSSPDFLISHGVIFSLRLFFWRKIKALFFKTQSIIKSNRFLCHSASFNSMSCSITTSLKFTTFTLSGLLPYAHKLFN